MQMSADAQWPVNTSTPLHVGAYLDERLLQAERQALFDAFPRYVGHELMVPNERDFVVLPHYDDGILLTRSNGQVQALSNVCRHRQSPVAKGRGNAEKFSCPLHRWTYKNDGTLLTAPKFSPKPCVNLRKYATTTSFEGAHFLGESCISECDVPPEFRQAMSFSGMVFSHLDVFECDYNWKTFVEFYLEDYHVAPFHPGLGRFVACDDLTWAFGQTWSIQGAPFYRGLQEPGNSEIYKEWHQAVLKYYQGKLPQFGAVWYLHYPNFMIEWYPMVTVISTVHPKTAARATNVVEFLHPAELMTSEEGRRMAWVAAQAYKETAVEDNEIGENMQKGRRLLAQRSENDAGPYHPVLEAGMQHFHDFIRSRLGPQL